LAVLASIGLFDYLRHRYRLSPKWQRLLPYSAVVFCAVAAVVVEWKQLTTAHAMAGLAIVVALGLLAMIYCEERRLAAWHLGAMFATVWLAAVGVQTFIMPVYDSYRAQTELANQINQAVTPGEQLYMLDLPENQITYYLRPHVVRLDRVADFNPELAGAPGQDVFVLAPLRVAEELARRGETKELARCSQINSYLTARDRLVFLKFGRALAAQKSDRGQPKKLE
jgi:hypothetical protein